MGTGPSRRVDAGRRRVVEAGVITVAVLVTALAGALAAGSPSAPSAVDPPDDTGLHAEPGAADHGHSGVVARPSRLLPFDVEDTAVAVAPAVAVLLAVGFAPDLRRRRLVAAPVCLAWAPRARGLRAPPSLRSAA